MKCFQMLVVSFLLGMVFGCNTGPFEPSESDKLTAKEKKKLTGFARRFLLRSRIKFSAQDRRIIISRKPKISAYYTGHKSGRLSIVWDDSDINTIIVVGNGDFFDKSCYWRVSVVKKEKPSHSKKKKR